MDAAIALLGYLLIVGACLGGLYYAADLAVQMVTMRRGRQ